MAEKVKKKKKSQKIISGKEPGPFRVERAAGRAPCVVVCDHASNRVPTALGSLGLSKENLKKHIAWDPGTEHIGRYISRKIDAPAVFASYSRLVVDLNRGPRHAECMRDVSDHIFIPGNAGLTPAQKRQRLQEIFYPYHAAIATCLKKQARRTKKTPLLISVHSFTPRMDGFRRPWHIGVLWNKEAGIAKRLVRELRRRNPRLIVGENEPYSMKGVNLGKNTIGTHAESAGLPYLILEFRQDLVSTKAKAEKWARIFYDSLCPILTDPSVYKRRRK